MYYLAEELVARVKQLDDFKYIPKGYWIIGIRNPEDNPDRFDDMFYLMFNDELVMETTGTTNPGVKILAGGFKRYNNQGAALVQSDRIYYNVWKYGMHLGKQPALKQLGAEITIYRDGDMDHFSEEIGPTTSGYYGINFHSDQHDLSSDTRDDDRNIGGWSAGCQVCNRIEDYRKFIESCKDQNSVTYCLLKEFSI
jgi:hypothetical protein